MHKFQLIQVLNNFNILHVNFEIKYENMFSKYMHKHVNGYTLSRGIEIIITTI